MVQNNKKAVHDPSKDLNTGLSAVFCCCVMCLINHRKPWYDGEFFTASIIHIFFRKSSNLVLYIKLVDIECCISLRIQMGMS